MAEQTSNPIAFCGHDTSYRFDNMGARLTHWPAADFCHCLRVRSGGALSGPGMANGFSPISETADRCRAGGVS